MSPLLIDGVIDYSRTKRITSHYDSKTLKGTNVTSSRIYGLSKLTETGVPLRPIVSLIASSKHPIDSEFNKILTNSLQPPNSRIKANHQTSKGSKIENYYNT